MQMCGTVTPYGPQVLAYGFVDYHPADVHMCILGCREFSTFEFTNAIICFEQVKRVKQSVRVRQRAHRVGHAQLKQLTIFCESHVQYETIGGL